MDAYIDEWMDGWIMIMIIDVIYDEWSRWCT